MGFIRKHKRGQDPYGSTPQGRRVPGKPIDEAHSPSRMWSGGPEYVEPDPAPPHGMPRPSSTYLADPNDESGMNDSRKARELFLSTYPPVFSVDTDPTPPHGIPRPNLKKSSKKKS